MELEAGDLLSLPNGDLILVVGFGHWDGDVDVIIRHADGSPEVWSRGSLVAISTLVQRADGMQ